MRRPLPHWVTRTRVAAACCAGLIGFGVVEATLPHRAPTSEGVPIAPARSRGRPNPELAVQQVAVHFVTACDTTSPVAPSGVLATEAVLAPRLAILRRPSWPAVWTAGDRRTTVALDPPGTPVRMPDGDLAVEVTGVMTVSSNTTPPEKVPVAETVLLRPATDKSPPGGHGPATWLVDGVELGS